jgi:rRNA maturation endonuclease Nob1
MTYICQECKEIFEVIYPGDDSHLEGVKFCPICGEKNLSQIDLKYFWDLFIHSEGEVKVAGD